MMASMNKRRHNNSSNWEEKAFAEDHLGGIMWPPRCYTCTFCQREFRSAQALGGHMNVHRRDRARLKLHSSLPNPNPSLFRVSAAHDDDHKEEDHQEKKDFLLSSSCSSSSSVKRVKLVTNTKISSFFGHNTKISSMVMFPAKKCSSEQEGAVVVEELDLELRLGNGASKFN